VFASAENLVDTLRTINPATHLFPIGVSLEKFEAAWRGETPEPPDVVGLRRPLVGLVGGLRACVDQGLLATLARNRPDWTFVLVGPEQVSFAELRDISNVHVLGPKPHDAVPAYVHRFDVCLVPYVVDSFTDNISPAKLNEYLALGKPVVSTALREVRRYNEMFGDVVAVASGASEFGGAIARALPDRSANAVARRRAAAEANSWQHRVDEMSQLIETTERKKRPT
jgi:O-antigen biosynthesis protein